LLDFGEVFIHSTQVEQIKVQKQTLILVLFDTDGVDSLHNCMDLGIQKGKQHRNRDIVAWVKKKRRNIRREDLLAFLCGKNPPARNRHASAMVRQSSRLSVERTHSPRLQGTESLSSATEPDLQAFREAIALQGTVI
jgi:hypothetical protein